MPNKKEGTPTVYPKTVSARFEASIIARIEVCAAELTKQRNNKHKKSKVLEICVNTHLPILERELKIMETEDDILLQQQVEALYRSRKSLKKVPRSSSLTSKKLGELADKLAASNDPAEIIRLKSAMTRGFYGE